VHRSSNTKESRASVKEQCIIQEFKIRMIIVILPY